MSPGRPPALEKLGVGPGDRVVLMLRNIPAFHVLDLATVFCGATPISIYNSSSPEQIAYLAGHCEAKVGVVEDDGFHERFLKVRDELPDLREIVDLAGVGAGALPTATAPSTSGRPPRSSSPRPWPRSSTPRAPPGRPRA